MCLSALIHIICHTKHPFKVSTASIWHELTKNKMVTEVSRMVTSLVLNQHKKKSYIAKFLSFRMPFSLIWLTGNLIWVICIPGGNVIIIWTLQKEVWGQAPINLGSTKVLGLPKQSLPGYEFRTGKGDDTLRKLVKEGWFTHV